MQESESSPFVGHEPCLKCSSSDALARYADGGAHCFACGYHEKTGGRAPRTKTPGARLAKEIIQGAPRALVKRGITEETCAHFGYTVGEEDGKVVQLANYIRDGQIVAQKVRTADKQFNFRGPATKNPGLYGQHLWRDSGKMLVITEGEIDALTVSQLQGNRWPVVSVPNGAQGAVKDLAKHIEWLLKFEKVIFMFDMDEPGRKAAQECAQLLPPGKAYIAELPLKDANAMLQAGRGADVLAAMWGAKPYRPDGIVSVNDIIEKIRQPPIMGAPWCFPTLTRLTYGRRPGDIYTLGAGTGVGKTDVLTQQIAFDVEELGVKVGVIYLEQPCDETGKRIAGKIGHRRFHVPDAGWTQDEMDAALEQLRDKVYFYDNFGSTEWEVIESKITYMAVALGVKHIYLDHLTALADPENERESLESLMAGMAKLAKRLGIIIHLVSHLSTPEGKPHEEGGRVTIRHFKGSRAIGFWSYFMFGLERDQQAEDPRKRRITTFRVLKDRYTGQATGQVFGLDYDEQTGMLSECSLESEDFHDETTPALPGEGRVDF